MKALSVPLLKRCSPSVPNRWMLPSFHNIEQAALLCKDFSQKQQFLNTVYEQFFQGFSVEVADTHGIVYTPQPIVDFMVKSVAHILETEFDRSLSDTGVHIIDPFVGTGNFTVRLMQDIQATTLEEKYRHELHCNEILLLPYYIASLNIEQEYFQLGNKEVKSKKDGGEAIFSLYSAGVVTSRDNLVYSFGLPVLQERVRTFIEIYNTAVDRKRRLDPKTPLENFIDTSDPRIKWSHRVKQSLEKLELSTYQDTHFRTALYRPFCQQYLYFDHFWNERRYQQHRILPIPETEEENSVICVAGIGNRKGFGCFATNRIPTFDLAFEKTQCFPFYTYDEDGTNRQENITDWALAQFRTHYGDDTITKWDIFHYNYAVLHHPDYREKYQANLKRDLPHIPFAEDFWGFANAGKALANLHVNYESVSKYDKLEIKETSTARQIDWQVEKMRFSKDKTQIYYNDYFTLAGIPAEAFAYQLGTRSALEWVVDQYRVKVDKRSGIVNDPNRADQPQYIVDLIGRVITVSLKTVEIVKGLPPL